MLREVPPPQSSHLSQRDPYPTGRENVRDRVGRYEEAMMGGPGGQRPQGGMGRQGEERSSEVARDFEKLLDDLQVPASIRQKLTPLDTPIKQSMLASRSRPSSFHSHSSPLNFPTLGQNLPLPLPSSSSFAQPTRTPLKQLRKTRSGSELDLDASPSPARRRAEREDSPASSAYSMRTVDNSRFVMITPHGLPKPTTTSRGEEKRRRAGSFGGGGVLSPANLPLPQEEAHHKPGFFASLSKSKHSKPPVPTHGRSKSKSTLPAVVVASTSAGGGEGGVKGAAKEDPEEWVRWVRSEGGLKMDVKRLGRLRMLLRHESTGWVDAFLKGKGYTYLLSRLQEVLDVEWREEQHDDQVLYELLRCIKAVGTSSSGKLAILSSLPFPHRQLSSLLFSTKKPGEVATRQLIVELMGLVLDLHPSGPGGFGHIGSPVFSTGSTGSSRTGAPPTRSPAVSFSSPRPASYPSPNPTITSLAVPPPPEGHPTMTHFLLSLLQPPEEVAPENMASVKGKKGVLRPASELEPVKLEVHDFLARAHRKRVFKTYLGEVSDVCRDYFWILCHGENNLWLMSELDLRKVERPKAPGGATGGVEFEAVDYLTVHFKLINALATSLMEMDMMDPKMREEGAKGEAWQFHSDMFASGMDRMLVTLRKASTDFYPHLHLELSRYIRHAQDSLFEVPYPIVRMLGSPPEHLRNREAAQRAAMQRALADKERQQREIEAGKQVRERGKQWLPESEVGGSFDFQM